MLTVVQLTLEFLQAFLTKNGNDLPAEVVASVSAAITALQKHENDLLTKANFEAQRG